MCKNSCKRPSQGVEQVAPPLLDKQRIKNFPKCNNFQHRIHHTYAITHTNSKGLTVLCYFDLLAHPTETVWFYFKVLLDFVVRLFIKALGKQSCPSRICRSSAVSSRASDIRHGNEPISCALFL